MKKSLPNLDLFTATQVAASIGVDPRTVRNWIASGRLPASRPGGTRYLIARADVEALISTSVTQPPFAPVPQQLPPKGNVTLPSSPAAPPSLSRAERRRQQNGRK